MNAIKSQYKQLLNNQTLTRNKLVNRLIGRFKREDELPEEIGDDWKQTS